MIYERHKLLTAWLTQLGVDEAIAAEDACRMEHIISKESLKRSKIILNHTADHKTSVKNFIFCSSQMFFSIPSLHIFLSDYKFPLPAQEIPLLSLQGIKQRHALLFQIVSAKHYTVFIPVPSI